MKNLNAWLVILAGVLLGLHAAGIFNLLEGVGSWALAVVVLLIGIFQLMKKK
ncbi:MAG: hypothetical protein KKF67_02790 [Nanoarchaeota archaeon]|nr:hypothetical protein [Nanoarchaeota archaeon]MBU3926136.1 hypothetical protein [Patescibacteria group bacterium]